MIFDLMVYAIFAVICLFQIQLDQTQDERAYLSKLNGLRGIFAIEIVVGHVIRFDSTYLYPLGKFMIISVAFFFFVSGFGMVYSFHHKSNYLRGFLIAKPLYLFLLTILMYGFNCLVDVVVPMNLGYCDWSQQSPFLVYFNETNWYMWVQILFYILFYLVYRFIKKYQILLIAFITFGFVTAMYLLGSSEGWYASALSFSLGLCFGEYFSSFTHALKKPWMWLVTVLLAGLGLSSLLMGENLISMVYLRNIMCIAGVLVVVYIASYLRIKNPVVSWLGKYSTEIYLFQFVYLKITEQTNWNYTLRIGFVVFATLITAFCIHPLFGYVHQICLKWSRKVKEGEGAL